MSNLTAILTSLFSNGRGEAGLEVGVDPGLSPSEHIRVPRSMVKAWAAKVQIDDDNVQNYISALKAGAVVAASKPKKKTKGKEPAVPAPVVVIPEGNKVDAYPGDPAACVNKFGWITSGAIYVQDGYYFVRYTVADEDVDVIISEFYLAPHTRADIEGFYAVNQAHIRAGDFSVPQQMWIHAVRFWSVVSGFVDTSTSREFEVVDNPTVPAGGAAEFVQFCIDFRSNAWTACAARAGTWRKTNHATGGDIVSGFARRWLSKMGYMSTSQNREVAARENRNVTSAFYIATHAACVHSVLANMAHADSNHWALVNPRFGMVIDWDIKDSALIRMVPNTQVAGGAMVADAVVVLTMLVKEGLAPLLSSQGESGSLIAAHEQLKEGGIQCATYAKWFLDGHPNGVKPVTFNQKESGFASLIGELGFVAMRYYTGTTIAGSAALQSAAAQMGSDMAGTAWAAIGRHKQTLSSDQVVAAYGALRGASAAQAVADLVSQDETTVRAAVSTFNDSNAAIAARLAVPNVAVADADVILGHRAAAPSGVRGVAPAPGT